MKPTITSPRMSQGLSLVELMVAITISSVLLLGVSSVYLSTRHSNAVQDEFARMQENGRFAIHTLTKQIRQAGYEGCINLSRLTPVNNVSTGGTNGPVDTMFDFSPATAITGHTCSGTTGADCTPQTPVTTLPIISGTDAITIRRSSSCSAVLTGNLGVKNANIKVTDNSCNFQKDEVLFITDCSSGDIFRATSVSGGGGTQVTVAHASNGNHTPFLSKLYGTDARVMKWERLTYYISACASKVSGCRSLWVNVDQGNTDVSTELVEYVDNMQIEYHVDKTLTGSGDPSVDAYMTTTDVNTGKLWPNVLAARIHLLTTTRDNVANQNNGKDETPYTFMGTKKKSTDRRYRREFTTTINIRNRTL